MTILVDNYGNLEDNWKIANQFAFTEQRIAGAGSTLPSSKRRQEFQPI
jgi:hypothetical protein